MVIYCVNFDYVTRNRAEGYTRAELKELDNQPAFYTEEEATAWMKHHLKAGLIDAAYVAELFHVQATKERLAELGRRVKGLEKALEAKQSTMWGNPVWLSLRKAYMECAGELAFDKLHYGMVFPDGLKKAELKRLDYTKRGPWNLPEPNPELEEALEEARSYIYQAIE